jgi:hypothetical protein
MTSYDMGTFKVNNAYASLKSGKREDIQYNNAPISAMGYDVDYFPDSLDACPEFKLIQVISYYGDFESYDPFLDNKNKDVNASPGYLESGGGQSTTGEAGGIFDAPLGGMSPTLDTGRPRSKGTWFIEVCAVCCKGTPKERILGCVRFNFDNATGKLSPKQYGSKNLDGGGFEVPSLNGPTLLYTTGRYQSRK